MLKYVDTEVTFAEVPNEISLCINLSNCPHKCKGCHSPYLQEDIGEELTKQVLAELISSNPGISCVCFMGGDSDIPYLSTIATYVKENFNLKTAWYTGLDFKPSNNRPICRSFDFVKVGSYIEEYGPLTSKTTNQRFYARGVHTGKLDVNYSMFYDITDKFWKTV